MAKKAASDLFKPLEERAEALESALMKPGDEGDVSDALPSPVQQCIALGFDPLPELVKLYREGTNTIVDREGNVHEVPLTPEQRMSVLKEIMGYVHGKPRGVQQQKRIRIRIAQAGGDSRSSQGSPGMSQTIEVEGGE